MFRWPSITQTWNILIHRESLQTDLVNEISIRQYFPNKAVCQGYERKKNCRQFSEFSQQVTFTAVLYLIYYMSLTTQLKSLIFFRASL